MANQVADPGPRPADDCPVPESTHRMVMPLGNEDQPRIYPWVTYLLIVINLGCLGLSCSTPLIPRSLTPRRRTRSRIGSISHNPFAYRVEPTIDPCRVTSTRRHTIFIHQAPGPRPIWLTLITSLFLHADLIHLAGNMLFLFDLRPEDRRGFRAADLPDLLPGLRGHRDLGPGQRPPRVVDADPWAPRGRSRASWERTWSGSRATGSGSWSSTSWS